MASIDKLLIANRGEIAVRIARTADRLGIATVGVYARPDANALHVDAVDLAVALGGASPAESYLRADAVVAAAVDTGCDAVHPGYGFLAENAEFAQAVIDAGLVWVGPTPEQIALLGDKVAAKEAAVGAGVPTTAAIAVSPSSIPDDLPMPALVKAAAGGGGRGMRIVRAGDDIAAAVTAAAREAEAAFGDGTVFIEPYIERGRHVEVQILGDTHGNVVHLGERECSIQRRNQKVVEESPSAGIDGATRKALCDGAVTLAEAVDYHGAGTVEFLVGDDGTINFLEVNTRLQVEHPVTEAVTGLDLVEMQLLVAAGEPLPITQDDVAIDGHAIEVRVVAEDPAAGWLPSTGAITAFELDHPAVRVDTGFRSGAVIGADYDSLLAKVIAHGPTRHAATRRLVKALRSARIDGVRTNIATLTAILTENDFAAGATPTSYLDAHPEVMAATGPTGEDQLPLLLAAVLGLEQRNRSADSATGFAPSGWRNLRTQGQRVTLYLDDVTHTVEYTVAGGADEQRASMLVGPLPEIADDGSLAPDDRHRYDVALLRRSETEQVLEVDGRRHAVEVAVAASGDRVSTRSRAGSLTWSIPERFPRPERDDSGSGPISPLPGTVISVHVELGQTVAEGDLLVVVEAMKMEHRITAAADGVVASVHFGEGDRVDSGDLLVTLE